MKGCKSAAVLTTLKTAKSRLPRIEAFRWRTLVTPSVLGHCLLKSRALSIQEFLPVLFSWKAHDTESIASWGIN